MQHTQLHWLANFIWGIADDVLRDVYVRGKYRDVILPMTVIRRLDAVLEPTKQAVLDMNQRLDNAGITNQDAALRQAARQAFYNASPFTLRDLRDLAHEHGKDVSIHLFGQEVNPETYAITKADLLLKGEGEEAENLSLGSTLSQDGFPAREFDFMLSNPPYGKSWKTDLERMGGKGDMRDPRFVIAHAGDPEYSLITRSSDRQLMFLVNMLSKMKHHTPLGSAFEETEQSKIFPNAAFGHWKITVERPLRLQVELSAINRARFKAVCVEAHEEPLVNLVDRLANTFGPGPHTDFNAFMAEVEKDANRHGLKLTARRQKLLQSSLGERAEAAAPVIKKIHKPGKVESHPLFGHFPLKSETGEGSSVRAFPPSLFPLHTSVVEYEPDPELRDTEQVPLVEENGIEAFLQREVLPHVADAWIDASATKIGYEISFTRYFYKPQPLRTLEEIRADIEALEQETEGLLGQILVDTEGVAENLEG